MSERARGTVEASFQPDSNGMALSASCFACTPVRPDVPKMQEKTPKQVAPPPTYIQIKSQILASCVCINTFPGKHNK